MLSIVAMGRDRYREDIRYKESSTMSKIEITVVIQDISKFTSVKFAERIPYLAGKRQRQINYGIPNEVNMKK